jgi:rubrerythrin
MNRPTIAQVFEVAIAAELASQALFQGLTYKFRHHADVAAFWQSYAQDETQHAQWLQSLQARLTPGQLSQPVDLHTVQVLEKLSKYSVEKGLQQVKDLEDAYQLVSEIENGETNAIFQFLLDNFERDESMREFLRAQVGDHVARLVEGFPDKFKGMLNRRAIVAAD